jgi:hypothetical protein
LLLALLTYLEANRQLHGNLTSTTHPAAISSSQGNTPQDAGTRGLP